MPKLICAAVDCKHIGKNWQCTAKKVVMSEGYVMTVYEGRQHIWHCKQYEMDEEIQRMEEQFKELMRNDRTDPGASTKEPLDA